MYIWLVQQEDTRGFDTYDSFVCVAPDCDTARSLIPQEHCLAELRWSPTGQLEMSYGDEWQPARSYYWASDIRFVTATRLGAAFDDESTRLVLASFNAG